MRALGLVFRNLSGPGHAQEKVTAAPVRCSLKLGLDAEGESPPGPIFLLLCGLTKVTMAPVRSPLQLGLYT